MGDRNKIGFWLLVVGWLVVAAGVVQGFNVASVGSNDPLLPKGFYWSLGLPYWLGGLFAGLFLIGLSEIVELLDSIKKSSEQTRLAVIYPKKEAS